MPNRILYESICSSETLDALSLEAERFFYRLLVQVDDFGRMDARPQVLRTKCFALNPDRVTPDDIASWLNEMERADLVRRYVVDNRPYLYFPTWGSRQRKRATHSKYPEPPCDSQTDDGHSLADDGQVSAECGEVLASAHEKRETRNENTRNEKRDFELEVFQIWQKETCGVIGEHDTRALSLFFEKGMDIALLAEAIAIARKAGILKATYCKGILARWQDDKILTLADLETHDSRGKPDPDTSEAASVSRFQRQLANADKVVNIREPISA